jgi:hypothetical protein
LGKRSIYFLLVFGFLLFVLKTKGGKRQVSGDPSAEKEINNGCSVTMTLDKALSESNISDLSKIWEQNARSLLNCESLRTEIQPDMNVPPPFLHRIWECSHIPDRYHESIDSWRSYAPEMYVFLWTNRIREDYIFEKLGARELQLYQRLVPGAYRADFFKYLLMYYVGGYYSDLDASLLRNITTHGFLESGTTAAVDLNGPRLLPGALMISPSRDPVFKCAMGEVLDHSAQRKYFDHKDASLDVTGPGVLGECVKHVTGRDEMVFQDSLLELDTQGYHLLLSKLETNNIAMTDQVQHVVQLRDGASFIILMPGGVAYEESFLAECDPGTHYNVLYEMKKIYATNESAGGSET